MLSFTHSTFPHCSCWHEVYRHSTLCADTFSIRSSHNYPGKPSHSPTCPFTLFHLSICSMSKLFLTAWLVMNTKTKKTKQNKRRQPSLSGPLCVFYPELKASWLSRHPDLITSEHFLSFSNSSSVPRHIVFPTVVIVFSPRDALTVEGMCRPAWKYSVINGYHLLAVPFCMHN